MKNNQSITVSAPGKLLLMGDHAVVYGRPCLVTAIDTRLEVTVEKVTDQTEIQGTNDTRFIDAVIAEVKKTWGIGSTGVRIHAKSTFSGKYGLGSSSAVTVAALKALVVSNGKNIDNRTLFDAAYRVVLAVQGVGSGFDVAAATYGGTLYFKTGGEIIEQLSIASMPLVVGYTGVKADTTTLVRQVGQKKEANPDKVNKIFDAIALLTGEAKTRMMEGDWKRVGKLMDFNQDYLRDLGVSSEKLESLISAAKNAGAWGAKLSGAGGGDCMIALASGDRRQAVEDAIAQAGGEVVQVVSNAPGVQIKTTDNQDELFIVVDRNDTIIGYKTRYECHHDKTLIHRTVGVLIFNDAGQLLLQKRSMTKDVEAGLWGISAAGHVTKGQTDDEAVHRELQEELGVDVPLSFIHTFITSNSTETERAALFRGKHNGPFTPNREEVAEVRFFDLREIKLSVASKALIFTDAALQALKEAGIL